MAKLQSLPIVNIQHHRKSRATLVDMVQFNGDDDAFQRGFWLAPHAHHRSWVTRMEVRVQNPACSFRLAPFHALNPGGAWCITTNCPCIDVLLGHTDQVQAVGGGHGSHILRSTGRIFRSTPEIGIPILPFLMFFTPFNNL